MARQPETTGSPSSLQAIFGDSRVGRVKTGGESFPQRARPGAPPGRDRHSSKYQVSRALLDANTKFGTLIVVTITSILRYGAKPELSISRLAKPSTRMFLL